MIRNQLYSCPSCNLSCIAKSDETILLTCRNCGAIINDETSCNLPPIPVPADWSFIQIGTKGTFADRTFEVLGRIRLQLRNDYKNCWTILFNDNKLGWLIESMGSLAVFGKDLHTIPADQTYTLKAGITIKIGTKIRATGEYVEKCEALSYEGEVGLWKEFSEGFFVVQASTHDGYIFLFTLRSEEDPSYLAGTKTDLQKLKLENSIEWNEWQ